MKPSTRPGWARSATITGALAALLCTAPGWAGTVPVGTTITGTVSGASSELLGLDSGYTSGPTSNVTALNEGELEFLTGDFALGIDFFGNGQLRIYNNSGSDLLPGDYSFTFDFAALPDALSGVELQDVAAIAGGTVTATRLSGRAIQLKLEGVSISGPFGSFTAQISTVPEPGSMALALAALGLLAGCARRRQQAGGAR